MLTDPLNKGLLYKIFHEHVFIGVVINNTLVWWESLWIMCFIKKFYYEILQNKVHDIFYHCPKFKNLQYICCKMN